MKNNPIVSREEWLNQRKELLKKEKEFTKLRDQLTQQRQALPWVRVDKTYTFEGSEGKVSLQDLFEDKSQLIVYHFMFDENWEEGCKSCSFWADNYNGIVPHLREKDANMVTISRTSLAKLSAFKERMGWNFKWYSSIESDFNLDFHVSKTREEEASGQMYYNYRETHFPVREAPGISIFYKDQEGHIYHTYSTYARGLDMMNTAYHYMDLLPKGRDEGSGHTMSWLKLRDEYKGSCCASK